jgi:hypothetical protein
MAGMRELKKAAIRAVLGCLVLCFLAAAPYMAAHAEHDCTGDGHCPGCLELRCALDLLRQLHTAAVRIGPPAGILGAAAASGSIPVTRAVPVSSVSLKVRMNT